MVRAVFNNMPSHPREKSPSLRRILDLDTDDLKFLGTVFRISCDTRLITDQYELSRQ